MQYFLVRSHCYSPHSYAHSHFHFSEAHSTRGQHGLSAFTSTSDHGNRDSSTRFPGRSSCLAKNWHINEIGKYGDVMRFYAFLHFLRTNKHISVFQGRKNIQKSSVMKWNGVSSLFPMVWDTWCFIALQKSRSTYTLHFRLDGYFLSKLVFRSPMLKAWKKT